MGYLNKLNILDTWKSTYQVYFLNCWSLPPQDAHAIFLYLMYHKRNMW